MQGLNDLTHLKTLDLGANRIRKMGGLSSLTSLESLWLGKNKIEKIENISTLATLRQLDIQNNRLVDLPYSESGSDDDMRSLGSLKELYLACNAISVIRGLPLALETVDLSTNKISDIAYLSRLRGLKEVWMTASLLGSFEDLTPLRELPLLECLYLEHSPVAHLEDYKQRVLEMLPTLQQLDAESTS